MPEREYMKKVTCITLSIIFSYTQASFNELNWMRYFWATYQQSSNNYEHAQQWYKELFDHSPSVYAYKGYVHFLDRIHDYPQIVRLSKHMSPTSTDSEIEMILARALASTGDTKGSFKKITDLAAKEPTNQEAAFSAAQVYIQQNNLEKAIETIDKFLNKVARRPTHFIFYFLKGSVLAQQSNKAAALKEIKESLSIHPQFDKAWLLYAIIHEQVGNIPEAVQGYSSYLKYTQEPAPDIEQHLQQLLFQLKTLQTSSKKPTKLDQARRFYKKGNISAAYTAIKSYLATRPLDIYARLMLIHVLQLNEQYAYAYQLLTIWSKSEPDNHIWYQSIHSMAHATGTWGTAYTLMSELVYTHPSLIAHHCMAEIAFKSKHYSQANACWQKVYDQSNDEYTKAYALYYQGIHALSLKESKKLEEIIIKSKNIAIKFTPLEHFKAQYYINKKQLKQADYILKNISASGNSEPTIQATKSWLLYKEHKYKQAFQVLKSINPYIQGCIPCVRAACIYHKAGQINAARDFFVRAQASARSSYDHHKIAQHAHLFYS